jgi:alpha-1,3-rhamnosyl/mannosyltransferase
MKIAIDASVLGTGRGGDESYLRGLLSGLALAADGMHDRFGLFTRRNAQLPAEVAAHPAFTTRPLNTSGRALRYVVALPLALAHERPSFDLVLTINHTPPLSTVARVLVIHDLSFLRHPEFYPRSTLLRLRWLVPLHVRQSRLVLTGSEFSRRDLIDAYGLAPERVVVVPPAIRAVHANADAAPPTGKPYFIYVGNLHPRKNLAGLVRGFRRALASGLDHQLVIVGASWWGDTSIASQVAGLPPGSVRLVGRVSDAERDHLLRGAVALVYPSLFEGIGLPPLEAMAAGTPVLASNAAALPETCGDAALLFDPRDDEAIASALTTVAFDASARASLRARGLERVSHFSARVTGERALDAFAQAIRSGANERRAIRATEEVKAGSIPGYGGRGT